MESIPYRFDNPVQAYQVLNRFGHIELMNDAGRLIRVHLSPTGTMARLDYRAPVEVPEIQVFLHERFAQGYQQRYKRNLTFRPLSAYGNPRNILGSGTYGEVTAYQRPDPLYIPGYEPMANFAIKTMLNYEELIPSTTFREISSLEMLIHPNIVEMIDVQETRNQVDLVMPLALGTLPYRQNLTILSPSLFTPNYFKFYIYQLVRGLAHMHMFDVWHYDIKPENILVFSHPQVNGYILKYADFGLSRNLTCSDTLENPESVAYSLWYRPPEILLGGEISSTSDVWALGVTIFQLILRRALLPGNDEVDQLNRIFDFLGLPNPQSPLRRYPKWRSTLTGSIQPEFNRNPMRQVFTRLPDGLLLYAMLESMLRLDPNDRADAISLMDSSYFVSIRSQVDNDPYFWAPRPFNLNCYDVLLTFEAYPGYDLNSENQAFRSDTIERIFHLWEDLNLYWKTFFVAVTLVDWVVQQHQDWLNNPILLATTCLMTADDMIQVQNGDMRDYVRLTHLGRNELVASQQRIFPVIANHLITATCYDFYQLDRAEFLPQVQLLGKYILMLLTQTMIPIDYQAPQVSHIALNLAANLYRQNIPEDMVVPLVAAHEALRDLQPGPLSAYMEINTGITLDALVASF